MSRHSETIDMLSDTIRWCQSLKGNSVIEARGEFLAGNSFNALDATEAQQIIMSTLQDADPVFWESNLCTVIDSAAPSLSISWRMTDPMLFTQSGYIWFARSLKPSETHNKAGCNLYERVQAISWKKRPKSMFIDIVFWVRPGPQSVANVFSHNNISKYVHFMPPELIRKARKVVQTNEPDRPLSNLLAEVTDWFGMNRVGGIPWVIVPWRVGETIEQTLTQGVLGSEIDKDVCDACNYYYFKTFAAALNFLNSKVFIGHQEQTDRSTVKRVEAKPNWSSVNVITLRHAERTKHTSDEDHNPVDWGCHWLVGSKDNGFWRQQYMPLTKTHQWRWIGVHIKGDTTKPFKPPSKRTYVVTR